jgi:hypothetical protein
MTALQWLIIVSGILVGVVAYGIWLWGRLITYIARVNVQLLRSLHGWNVYMRGDGREASALSAKLRAEAEALRVEYPILSKAQTAAWAEIIEP